MPLEMELTPLDEQPGVWGRLEGALEGEAVREFEELVGAVLRNGHRTMYLDLGSLRYVNSSGLGAIIQARDRFHAKGGRFVLVAVPRKISLLLRRLGLLETLEVYPDRGTALGTAEDGSSSQERSEPL